ncbi:hypothetical protein AB0M02_29475 [Actinoplanes sp. NPDC051861]|uniref:hypothetical protein n=1 Tax=Actinoplanes sp. NPDC051861 TaxID=3155170 RepID=UPI003415BAA7
MTRTRGLVIAAATIPMLLGACAQPGTTPVAGAADPVTESASQDTTAVIRVEYRGGFVPPDFLLGRLPMVSVYADGRVITDGPVPLIAPGPALPNLQVQQVGPAVVEELTREALEAGVKTGYDFGSPGVADVPSTRVTVVTAEGTQVAEAVALSVAQADDPALSAEQKAARKKLAKFVDRLTALPTAEGMAKPAAYVPEEVAALASPWTDPGDGLAGKPVAWPGPALPGEALNASTGTHCVTATGAQKDAVWAAAEKANQQTPWESAGKQWRVLFRPLLPDESGCDSLRSAG